MEVSENSTEKPFTVENIFSEAGKVSLEADV